MVQTCRKPLGPRDELDWHAVCTNEKEHKLKPTKERLDMLSWAVTFLIVALIAAALGFTGIAGTAVGFAKILFVVFMILFLFSLLLGRGRA
jgi:uncharacterized membrane protein YtjA (UPF0391 family)